MAMLVTHKVRLYPTPLQVEYLKQSCGVSRFAFNWALEQWSRQYEAHKKDKSLPLPSEGSLRKDLNAIKGDVYPWMLEVSKCAPQQAIKNVGRAFVNFFAKRGGYPRFKKKGERDSFYLDNDSLSLSKDGKRLLVPCPRKSTTIDKAHRDIKMAETFRFPRGKLMSCTISCTAGKWYAAITVEVPEVSVSCPGKSHAGIGLDAGLKDAAVLSDGTRFKAPKSLQKNLVALRRESKSLSRKKKGSANRKKARQRLARIHDRIRCVRMDTIHKMTTFLTKTYPSITVEDLNIKGMIRNRHLARSIADVAWGEIRRQLKYKGALFGCRIIEADRFFPSSQLSSCCGVKHPAVKNLNVRRWNCPSCGKELDRDVNAAENLRQWGERFLHGMAESSPVIGPA